MKSEKLFPIAINPSLCVRCQRCAYSCHPKAIFFENSFRYVNYDKCGGCLKCVDVCEHGAIEVISLVEGSLEGFSIDSNKCSLCKTCIEDGFCPKRLFILSIDENENERIEFNASNVKECSKCLKCFKTCPFNAILPNII